MELTKLHTSTDGHIRIITMDCPANLNAVDEVMADELLYALEQAECDPEASVVVLESAGRAFSAGGDIGYFYQLAKAGGDTTFDSLMEKVAKVAVCMKRMSKPVITSVSGAAAGAGFSLALGGDYLFCAENAKFILAFVNLGLVPDTGATYLLAKSIGTSRTFELASTGRVLTAKEAKEWGIAYKVSAPEELHKEVMAFAAKLAAGPLISYKNLKKQIYAAAYADYKQWLQETELPTQHECASSDDFREGVRSFMEKRPPVFRGR